MTKPSSPFKHFSGRRPPRLHKLDGLALKGLREAINQVDWSLH